MNEPSVVTPALPTDLILHHLLPFVSDRITWNSACHAWGIRHLDLRKDHNVLGDSHEATKKGPVKSGCHPPPWPSTLVLGRPILTNISRIAVSPDGHYLACASISRVDTWSVWDGHVSKHYGGAAPSLHGRVIALSFSSDSQSLAACSEDGSLALWRFRRRREPTSMDSWELSSTTFGRPSQGHRGGVVTDLCFCPYDSHTLYLVFANTCIWQLNINSAATVVIDIPLNSNNESMDDQTPNTQLARYHSVITLLRDFVAVRVEDFDLGMSIRLWKQSVVVGGNHEDSASRQLRSMVAICDRDHDDSVDHVAISTDANYLAAAGHHGMVLLWKRPESSDDGDHISVSSAQRLLGLESDVTSLAFSPDSKLLAAADVNGYVLVWDLKGGRLIADLEGFTRSVHTLAFTAQGHMLAAGGIDGAIRFWSEEEWFHPHCDSPTA